MITIVIQIGNSDDKLSQGEWANYISNIHSKVKSLAKEIHFFGGSSFDTSWQNACLAFEINEALCPKLYSELKFIREFFEQDSIAIIQGETIFV